jgi:hypothetical protein
MLAPGGSVMLRFENNTNRASMLKFRYLLLSKMNTEFSLSAPSSPITLSVNMSNNYSDFDKAFFIDLCYGWTKKIPLGNANRLLLDIGPSLNVTVAESKDVIERGLGFGVMFNGGFQFGLSKHLRLELGLNIELGLTLGSRSEPGLSILSSGFMLPVTPYLALGYNF